MILDAAVIASNNTYHRFLDDQQIHLEEKLRTSFYHYNQVRFYLTKQQEKQQLKAAKQTTGQG